MPVVSTVSALEIERRARGLSQAELASRAGVSADTVSLIERGRAPSMRTAHALARVLGAGLDVLFAPGDERST